MKDGSALLPDNAFNGIDFSLPFYLRDHRWYFGTHNPVSLSIKEI
ncbi:hypothetical protein ACZ87_01894 [Candidatus Erwinia dacicola]|uniref:Uncharacterized protein n=1 Tax=Candidatus Erwinia dacicola TaxID=252393 RepID=A0A328TQU7_9GAMM|nr:hypothetical protein [Candidatus Erwinia dacicola]RAP71295.1 hypothetical protein ACZ87_01894 [Candidatus Erwinia dacicola]